MRWCIFLLVLCGVAYAAPSVKEVEMALHLTRGAAFSINVGGQQIELTYVGIEPMKGHRYAIIVDAY